MAYKIEYIPSGAARRITKFRRDFRPVCTFLLVCALIGVLLWSVGGDWGITRDAFENMATQLAGGNDLRTALVGFCLEIIEGA